MRPSILAAAVAVFTAGLGSPALAYEISDLLDVVRAQEGLPSTRTWLPDMTSSRGWPT
jgi:hypothetical protein